MSGIYRRQLPKNFTDGIPRDRPEQSHILGLVDYNRAASMSEWAIGNGDTEERTAYEYREFYLGQGIKVEPFYCPFCGIPLAPVNLYKEELARSPHFRAYKEQHRFGCDGHPRIIRTRDGKPTNRHVEKREFHLPEVLAPRRAPVVARHAIGHPGASNTPDEREVNRRRQEAAKRLGPAIYRTSLIRSVAIAFLGVFRESFEQQRMNNWSDKRRREWATNLLRESRLTLYDGFTLTYHSAIRNARFPPPPKPRIFHGLASAFCVYHTRERTEYLLVLDTPVKHKKGEDIRHYPVEITISAKHVGELTGSQRHTLVMLDKAANEGLETRWFAYGVMLLQDDCVYRMTIENIDYLYLHTLKKPVSRP